MLAGFGVGWESLEQPAANDDDDDDGGVMASGAVSLSLLVHSLCGLCVEE